MGDMGKTDIAPGFPHYETNHLQRLLLLSRFPPLICSIVITYSCASTTTTTTTVCLSFHQQQSSHNSIQSILVFNIPIPIVLFTSLLHSRKKNLVSGWQSCRSQIRSINETESWWCWLQWSRQKGKADRKMERKPPTCLCTLYELRMNYFFSVNQYYFPFPFSLNFSRRNGNKVTSTLFPFSHLISFHVNKSNLEIYSSFLPHAGAFTEVGFWNWRRSWKSKAHNV